MGSRRSATWRVPITVRVRVRVRVRVGLATLRYMADAF